MFAVYYICRIIFQRNYIDWGWETAWEGDRIIVYHSEQRTISGQYTHTQNHLICLTKQPVDNIIYLNSKQIPWKVHRLKEASLYRPSTQMQQRLMYWSLANFWSLLLDNVSKHPNISRSGTGSSVWLGLYEVHGGTWLSLHHWIVTAAV